MDTEIKNLALSGDWDAAVDLARHKIKAALSPVQVAQWLTEAGLGGDRSVQVLVQRVCNCLNPNSKEFFKSTEWWVIQKRSGITTMFELECMFLGLGPHPVLAQHKRKEELKRRADALESELRRVRMEIAGEIPGAPSVLLSLADDIAPAGLEF